MTIAAGYLSAEGVVFGADSTTTFSFGQPGPGQTLKFYNSAQKVFEIGPMGQARFGLCTWGDGRLGGNVSHRAVAARLADKATATSTVQDLSNELVSILEEPAIKAGRDGIGYLLGGIDVETRTPACSQILAAGQNAPQILPLKMEDAIVAGAPRFFSRMDVGYDSELPALVAKHLRPLIPNAPADLDTLVTAAVQAAARELPGSVTRGLPLRDAIDFVHTYLHLTIKAHKFMLGPTLCGGTIEVGFVSVDRPFRWVRHKSFDSAIDEVL